jgi:hypothetical protein
MKGEIDTGNLDIIITHYKEPWAVGKPAFDMLALQRMVNFDDVGVILVNDGEENELPSECFDGYPFSVCQMSIPKGGVSKARNAGLDASTADWVMFCDFDDCFSSVMGLYLVFCAMQEEKYDTLWSNFTEETQDSQGRMVLVSHGRDYVFVHGKAHRRQFLVDNNLRFHDKLTIHEDAYFNMLVQTIAGEGRTGSIKTPIYLWKWNGNSVVRRDRAEDYILDTYDHLIRQKIAITEEMIKRGMTELTQTVIVKTIVDAYYDCQQATWRTEKVRDKVRKAENWFAAYLKRYAGFYAKADIKIVAGMMRSCRENALNKGTFFVEAETLKQFLERIMQEAKPIPVWDQNV